MPPATEIAALRLKGDSNVEDPTSPAGQQFKKCLQKLAEQKGFQRQVWGVQMEDPSLLIWVIDWDDAADHAAFIASPEYKVFLEIAGPVFSFDHKPWLIHSTFVNHPPTAPLEAPVTEFCFFALPADATEEQKTTLQDTITKIFQSAVDMGACSAFSVGWVIQKFDHEKGTDGKAVVLNGFLGWKTREEHLAFRETPIFTEAVKPVRSMVLPPTTGVSGTTMYHVKMHHKA